MSDRVISWTVKHEELLCDGKPVVVLNLRYPAGWQGAASAEDEKALRRVVTERDEAVRILVELLSDNRAVAGMPDDLFHQAMDLVQDAGCR